MKIKKLSKLQVDENTEIPIGIKITFRELMAMNEYLNNGTNIDIVRNVILRMVEEHDGLDNISLSK